MCLLLPLRRAHLPLGFLYSFQTLMPCHHAPLRKTFPATVLPSQYRLFAFSARCVGAHLRRPVGGICQLFLPVRLSVFLRYCLPYLVPVAAMCCDSSPLEQHHQVFVVLRLCLLMRATIIACLPPLLLLVPCCAVLLLEHRTGPVVPVCCYYCCPLPPPSCYCVGVVCSFRYVVCVVRC